MGVVSLLSERSARSPTSPGRVSERQVLPLLGLGRGCSQRTQKAFGTAMRLCASLFRGVAAPLGCVICLQLGDVAVFFTLRTGLSAHARWWYYYPRRALRAAETPDGRLSKRLICRFLRSGGRSSPHDSYFLANTQNFLLAVPVANAFALWYDKFSKLEVAYFFITKDLLSIARIVASIPSRWSYSCCMSSDISSSIRISCFSQFSSV